MRVIQSRNVNDAWLSAINMLGRSHVVMPSRAGEVMECPDPVSTVYQLPEECVLWDPQRDASPWLHFFEAVWMLAGRNDIAYLKKVSNHIASFVDDGTGFQHGAYGHRWRKWFGFDQLNTLVDMLRNDPTTRRAVLQMWAPIGDLVPVPETGLGGPGSVDVPCNLTVAFSARSGKLDMTVFCRSNDIIFGCYGANAVHFSFLLQYMAARTGIPIGKYTQVSNNWHAYTKVWNEKVDVVAAGSSAESDFYRSGHARPHAMLTAADRDLLGGGAGFMLDRDIEDFLEQGMEVSNELLRTQFFNRLAVPLRNIWLAWKGGDRTLALLLLREAETVLPNNDWLLAARRWMERRAFK